MSEITKESVLGIVARIRRSFPDGNGGESMMFDAEDVYALCEMALRSLDHAADARLGARVREVCEDGPPATDDEAAAFVDELRMDGYDGPAKLVETIAAVLREEQADAVRGEGR